MIERELSDQEVAEFALIENVQRADLHALEEAGGYHELMEKFSYTQEQIAHALGKSRSHVANTLRLLKLPPRVQALVREGKLSPGAARALIGHEHIDVLVDEIVARGMSVREVEALVSEGQEGVSNLIARVTGNSPPSRAPSGKDADTRAFEKDLSDLLGLKE